MTQPLDPAEIDIEPSDGDSYADREVPDGIGRAFPALAGEEAPASTLGELMRVLDRPAFSPDELPPEQMLVTDDSRHEVRLGDRTVHTYCFLDALVLAFLEGEPVVIATRPPGASEPIELTASPQGLVGVDEGMVVSFGFSTELPTEPDAYQDRPVEEVQDTIHEHGCPKINLFPDREAYEAWAEEADAVTMPIPLAEALALACDTVERWASAEPRP